MKNIARAIGEWEMLLGRKNVNTNIKELDRAVASTFLTSKKLMAIIKPTNLKSVQKSILIANNYRIPIYPVSTGKNWGYGSKAPTVDSCVVMDMGMMNKILDFNEDLGYIKVEPGVTFQHLHRFLLKKKSNLMMSNIGGSPDSSLIGNFLERGIGRGLYGNKYDFGCNLEIVLPTGEIVNTGDNNFSRTKVGPDVAGLFTQSNFGVVTRMTFWLSPIPKYSEQLLFYLENDSNLIKFIDGLRILKLEQTIMGNFLISNEFRSLTKFEQYPWQEAKGKTPLSEELLQKLKCKHNILGQWSGYILINAANKIELSGKKLRIIQILKKIKGLAFFFKKSKDKNIPSILPSRSMYWRKKIPIPKDIDPGRDKCGIIWISPTAPFMGKDIFKIVEKMKRIMLKYRFEPDIGINCVSDRKIYLIGSILFDREITGEDEKALKCYDEIFSWLVKYNYIPYRLSLHSMENFPKPNKGYIRFIKLLKTAIDPNNILAPGRYDFRKYW